MKKIIAACVFGMVSLGAGEISIAVAANMGYAIETLKKEFNTVHPETKIQVILGSSGKLVAQIKHGAPYGLFMSADMNYPDALYTEKTAVSKPVIYAQGALAFLSVKQRNYSEGIAVLNAPDVKKIAIANPKTAPYGVAAIEAMKNVKLYDKLKDKFVYAESISQTVAYAMTAADIGVIAKSSLFSPKMSHFKEGLHWSEVDQKLYTPIDQGMVILKEGEGNAEVKAFYDFVLGDKAKEIFKQYGYKVI